MGEFVKGKTSGNAAVLSFAEGISKIDIKNFEAVESEAEGLVEELCGSGADEVVFDLKGIAYVSSAGLRMFSAIHSFASDLGAEYKLVNARADIVKLFQLTGYSSIFPVEEEKNF